MSEFLEFLTKLLPIVTALITAYGAYRIARNKDNMEIIKNRYYDIIFPIFDLLEPYLFSDNFNFEIINEVEDIINKDNNRAIAGRRLIYLIELCKNTENIKNYKRLCIMISNEHDFLCKKLKIPARNERYRIERRQYPSNTAYLFSFFYHKIYLPIVYIFFSIIFLIFFIAALLVLVSSFS